MVIQWLVLFCLTHSDFFGNVASQSDILRAFFLQKTIYRMFWDMCDLASASKNYLENKTA